MEFLEFPMNSLRYTSKSSRCATVDQIDQMLQVKGNTRKAQFFVYVECN